MRPEHYFPDDPESVQDAEDQIAATGRTWVDGGAAPLFLLVKSEVV